MTDKQIERFRKCAAGIMARYFSLLQNETVVEDLHTFTKEPYGSHPAGTTAVIAPAGFRQDIDADSASK